MEGKGPLKEPGLEDERIAALLDGRIAEPERARTLAQIAASDEDFAVFAEAAAVLRESEEAEAPGNARTLLPPSAHRRGGWRRAPGVWMALAAVLVMVALVPLLRSREGTPAPTDPTSIVSLMAARDAGLPPGWTEHRPWGAALGATDPLRPDARAARVGALHVDLALAVRVRDATASRQLAGEIVALLDEVRAPAPLSRKYQELARQAGDTPERLEEPLRRAGHGAVEILGEVVEAGGWVEAGRIAAARRDAGFFRTRTSRAALDRASEIPGLTEVGREAAERIRAIAGAEGEPDWDALRRDLDTLLGALAS